MSTAQKDYIIHIAVAHPPQMDLELKRLETTRC